jgi:mRNA (2'-O-methyladenosine-N6-)-methyltransferase
LRPKKSTTIFDSLKLSEKDLKGNESAELDEEFKEGPRPERRRRKKKDLMEDDFQYEKDDRSELNMAEIYDDKVILDKLPKKKADLERLLEKVKQKLVSYKRQFIDEQIELQNKTNHELENSVPICADITNFDFELLRKKQLEFGQRLFDVIMMDPPWKLSTSQPSRGVAIQYDSLVDDAIERIPVEKLQTDGFIFVWYKSKLLRAINAKYRFSCKLIEKWGYKVVDEITWVKKTVNGKIAKGHGYYLQHAK